MQNWLRITFIIFVFIFISEHLLSAEHFVMYLDTNIAIILSLKLI